MRGAIVARNRNDDRFLCAREPVEHGRNGEMMVEVKKKTATKSAKKKANCRARNGSRARAEDMSAATRKKSVSEGEPGSGEAGQDGAELLRRAVNRRVGNASEELARVLINKALDGDSTAVKTVVGLAEAKKPDPVKRVGPTLAQRLEKEPRWEGKAPETGE